MCKKLYLLLCVVLLSYAGAASISSAQDTAKNETAELADITELDSQFRQTQILIDEANMLISTISKSEVSDRSHYIDEIRVIRSKITKRSPLLRTSLETARVTRDAAKATLARLNIERPALFNPLLFRPSLNGQIPYSNADNIELTKIKIEELKSNPTANSQMEIRKLEVDLRALERRKEEDEKLNQDHEQRTSTSENERTANIAKSEAIAQTLTKTISRWEGILRDLDETLNVIDDVAGQLLQVNAFEAEYTDRSTIVFSVLVGGVILGFFVVALRSTSVQEAIFTGDSGIQFVTLFSLVIAIILFGILRILEGKELSALLGGLSGYILGRGSFGPNKRNIPTTLP